MGRPSKLEETLWVHLRAICAEYDLPLPQREFRFYLERKWRADFCWPKRKLIVEVEGGVWTGGRHSRGGRSFLNDMEKYNTASILGYRLLRVAGDHISSGQAITWILQCLGIEDFPNED
jgi:very-short-patch-repair endonuclease